MTDVPPGAPSESETAWLATVIGIPLFAAVAAALGYGAAPAARQVVDEGPLTSILVAVAVADLAILVVGIAAISHTLGRVLFRRTLGQGATRAVRAFALMGVGLAVIPIVGVALASDEPLAGAVFAAVAVGVPCVITTSFTRAVLPSMAANRGARRIITLAALATLVIAAVWAALVLPGLGD